MAEDQPPGQSPNPAGCPKCGASGALKRAITEPGNPLLIRVELRCPACSDSWAVRIAA
jgi:hypothetical protein